MRRDRSGGSCRACSVPQTAISRRPRRRARHHRRAPRRRRGACAERCPVVHRPAGHREVRARPVRDRRRRRSSVSSASRVSSRRWPSATPGCTSWCSRSSTASIELAEPQRVALDAVLGRVQPRPRSVPRRPGGAEPCRRGSRAPSPFSSSSTTRSGSTTSRRWRCRSSGAGSAQNGRRCSSRCVRSPDARVRFEGLRRIDLGGLSAPEALDLLTAATGVPVDETVASRIVAATGGNPLALVELPGR